MELDLQSQTALWFGIFAFLVFLCSLSWLSIKSRRPAKRAPPPPEAGGAWPLIGHLPHLVGSKTAHLTLGKMADTYGPIFTLRLGVYRSLVVSSWEIAKECLTINDKTFASRPKFLAPEIMGYNYAMFGFSPYGPYWRHVRKIATLEVLSIHRLEKLRHVRVSEIKATMKELHHSSGNVVEMKSRFEKILLNVLFRVIMGKPFYGDGDRNGDGNGDGDVAYRKALRSFFELGGAFTLSDVLPYLRWLDLGGYEKAMKKTGRELNQVLDVCLEEHKQKRKNDKGQEHIDDFMDVILSLLDGPGALESSTYDADTITKATCLAIISGGTDSTTVTITWALSLLLNNREALKKAQNELDIHVGRERLPEESDAKNLVYLQAIIKETMRLYPAAPLSVPHESTEDCIVDGYHVPAGTRLLVNIYKIHRDPRVWPDPLEFRPERFLTTHKGLDVKGHDFELIPFGSGRRMCPGISFALQVIQLTLANLLHGFDISTPSNELVDMTEDSGLTNIKATPLEVILTPRLPAQLYG
ncbi:Cytochrome P450 [Quillaja saponaria]|uniref:Cytochrome P450 n=1 Tax=Quillaja saponaria TaxID=32244 RepID=A0AAD7LYI4_QUISA|nr:Cytochrome P450 [Quillaja saponaria]